VDNTELDGVTLATDTVSRGNVVSAKEQNSLEIKQLLLILKRTLGKEIRMV